MLNNDPLAEQFVGGTVYQGFLINDYMRLFLGTPLLSVVLDTEFVEYKWQNVFL